MAGFNQVQIAHPGQLDDLLGRNDAVIAVAVIAPRLQVGQDRGDVFLDEQKVGDDDVAMAHGPIFASSSAAGGFSAHSAAAWTLTFRPGKLLDQPLASPRAAGPAAWLSSVTMTTR